LIDKLRIASYLGGKKGSAVVKESNFTRGVASLSSWGGKTTLGEKFEGGLGDLGRTSLTKSWGGQDGRDPGGYYTGSWRGRSGMHSREKKILIRARKYRPLATKIRDR